MGDRPQAIINNQLVESCDLLIGVFWTRIGTDTGVALSGTVEEIQQFVASKRPVLLYFSETPITPAKIDQEQYSKLRSFKQEIRKNGIVFDYNDLIEFRVKLYNHLTSTVEKLHSGKGKTEQSNLISHVSSYPVPNELLRDQAKDFRHTRVGEIAKGDTPMPLVEGARVILHSVPLMSFKVDDYQDYSAAVQKLTLHPISSSLNGETPNYDGRFTYSTRNDNAKAYVQMRTNGIIESVECSLVRAAGDGGGIIPGEGYFEQNIVVATESYLSTQKSVGISPPIYLFLTLDGISGFRITFENSWLTGLGNNTVDRSTLELPGVEVSNYETDVRIIMKPIFDRIWNAAKYECSLAYGVDGKWVGYKGR